MIAEEDIQRVARRIGEAINAERVILFGSHARGDAGAHSDVDWLQGALHEAFEGAAPADGE